VTSLDLIATKTTSRLLAAFERGTRDDAAAGTPTGTRLVGIANRRSSVSFLLSGHCFLGGVRQGLDFFA
jgi:hypothetical protein